MNNSLTRRAKKLGIVLLGISVMASQSVLAAGSRLEPLMDGDLTALASGAACWLQDDKGGKILQDDMASGLIRWQGQALKLQRVSGDWKHGFFNCGQTYRYRSQDGKTQVLIKMAKPSKKECLGEVTLESAAGRDSRPGLKADCGA